MSQKNITKDIRNKKIKCVIVYRLDRISRNVTDFCNLKNEFIKYNTDFISVTENFDTSTPMGRAMLMISSVFAQLEREVIAERISLLIRVVGIILLPCIAYTIAPRWLGIVIVLLLGVIYLNYGLNYIDFHLLWKVG